MILAAAIAWGLRVTISEGFLYEWSLGFSGDFNSAMYDPTLWDGTGFMYGPVFVAERWLVNAWPRLFTVQLFALAHAPAMAVAFGLAAAASGARGTTVFVVLAVWLCSRQLYYPLSVAANPEILELLFLTVAWYAATRARPSLAWSAAALATLTKVIPAIFAPVLLLRASRRAVTTGVITGLAVVAVAGAGQHLSPRQTVMAVLVPSQGRGGGSVPQITHIEPIPSSSTAVGLNSAIARAANLGDHDPAIGLVQTVATAVTILVYLACVAIAANVLNGGHTLPEVTRLALSYGLLFALMPLLTFHTHRHTFVFLLPAWTAVIAMLVEDGHRRRAMLFGAMFGVAYVLGALPAAIVPADRLLGTRIASSALIDDPIWANIVLIVSLAAYAVLRTRDAPAAQLA